jgi:hypothetical protein
MEHVVLNARPYSFADHPYMAEIHRCADSPAPVVNMKAGQSGGSTEGIVEAAYHADARSRAVIYYLPTDITARSVVREKLDPLIGGSPRLRARTREIKDSKGRVENIHTKRIGSGWLYVRGAKSRLAREATPADIVILDERDHFEEEWIPEIRVRLNASNFKGWREICKPTHVGGAIHAGYEASDRRRWTVKCTACGDWSDLDWFRDVVVEEADKVWKLRDRGWMPGEEPRIFCPACGRPRDRLGPGTWVQQNPERETRGFHVSRLFTATTSIRELWTLFEQAVTSGDPSKLQGFYNGDLGLPYTPESAGLTDTLLDDCVRNYRMPDSLPRGDGRVCSAGFDVQGDYLVGRISEVLRDSGVRIRRAVWIGRIGWDDLDGLFARVPVGCAVIDGAYDPTMCKKAQARHPFLWLAFYPNIREGADWIQMDDHRRVVNLERTQSLDRSHADILTHRNILPRNARTIPEYYKEMRAAVRVVEEDSKGVVHLRWRKNLDADDYRQADNYDHAACEIIERGHARAPSEVSVGGSKREAALSRLIKVDEERAMYEQIARQRGWNPNADKEKR